MLFHTDMTDQALMTRMRRREITFAGHRIARIYGRLSCKSGKRMGRAMRVFFTSEEEAISYGLRPCGHCMPLAYRQWRSESERGIKARAEKSAHGHQAKGQTRPGQEGEKACMF